jgi:outer membrane protein assembly factor BamE
MHRAPAIAFWLASCALLAACDTVPRIPGVTPHRIEIQQGNYVSQEMVAQLKPGMSKDQVRFILGTPLVTDIFHADRWDYVYFREAPDGKREQRKLSVIFDGGKLARLGGDVVPAGTPHKAAAPAPGTEWDRGEPPGGPPPASAEPDGQPAKEPAKQPAAQEKGFFGRLLERLGL